MLKPSLVLAAAASLGLGGLAIAQSSRDYISIVGSSTVYPFTTAVAESFGKSGRYKTPKVESTGTGGGIKLFCNGVGVQHPDVANASRRIKASEVQACAKNGVKEVTEIKVGYDGIVVANARSAQIFKLSRKDLYLALAKQVPDPANSGKLINNPYKTWREINKILPADKIEVLGPPPTSGTRDAFLELVMEPGCESYDWIAGLAKSDKNRFKSICHTIREDGGYIEAGENDNLIVQKLDASPKTLGIFGYSFLEENLNKLHGSLIDGKQPTFENIASGDYPVSRALFIYVKKAHVGVIPGLKEFVAEYTSERAFGQEGYLVDKGLIPLGSAEAKQVRANATGMANLKL